MCAAGAWFEPQSRRLAGAILAPAALVAELVDAQG